MRMTWEIESGGERVNPGGYDGWIWLWRLRKSDDPERRHSVSVGISGTALSMDETALPPRIVIARETEGRSEVEQVLEWPDPPDEITVGSQRVTPVGGDPGPEQRELLDIIDWFEERGLLLWFAAHGIGGADGATIVSQTHSAHVVASEEDKYLGHFEGPTRLAAARAAKAHWEREVIPAVLKLGPATVTSSAHLKLSVGAASEVETLKEQGFHLVWIEPSDPKEPIWMVEVFNEDGELITTGLGDNVEDALLGVAEDLLPDT